MEKYGMAMAAWEAFGRPLIEDNKPKQKPEHNEPIKKPKELGMLAACRHLVSDIIDRAIEEEHKDNP